MLNVTYFILILMLIFFFLPDNIIHISATKYILIDEIPNTSYFPKLIGKDEIIRSPENLLFYINILYKNHQYQLIDPLLEETVNQGKMTPLLYNLWAKVQYTEGNLTRAARLWIIAGNYRNAISASWESATKIWMTKPDEARALFDTVVYSAKQLRNSYWQSEGYRMICATYREEKLYDLAVKNCDLSLKINPSLASALAEKGYNLFLKNGKNEESTKLINEAINLDTQNAYYQNLSDLVK
jgi:tetratricopeptide (TPR) repeat protein